MATAPQCTAAVSQHTLQHIATHCNTLQHTATHCNTRHHTATYCNSLQHTTAQRNLLQHCNIHFTTHCNWQVCDSRAEAHYGATHCNTLQLRCNTLQHTANIKYMAIFKGHCAAVRCYGVATVSRINKIIGLFCRILSLL